MSNRSPLLDEFKDKEYREDYTKDHLYGILATQLKVLREQRGLKQFQLADKAGMAQNRISVLEDVNYQRWTVSTLIRLAQAMDLRIRISFEEYGTFFEDDDYNRESLQRRSFEDDPVFK